MRVYLGFDDTDVAGADRGTGRLARWFEQKLPHGVQLYGVIRQQLPVMEGIPYTSKNSAACLILENVSPSQLQELINRATAHIHEHFMEGSDPGLCVVSEESDIFGNLIDFGRLACTKIVTQEQALRAACGAHLSGHGGANDGIIGAAAGVGLTLSKWSGRFIEFNGLRNFDRHVSVSALESHGIRVLSIDRNALVPGPDDVVDTNNWLRPRLWAGRPVLPVLAGEFGSWQSIGAKNI